MIELDETMAGHHVSHVIAKAIALADNKQQQVHFQFNDTNVYVDPGSTQDDVYKTWDATREADYQALINSPEYKEHQARQAQEQRDKETRVLTESASTEYEMRKAKSPWPLTEKQLVEYIKSLVDRQHDYGTSAYAMSLAASAAFNYVAHKLGTTGFQASCADLDFFRRSRRIDGPFIVLKGEDELYPQYNLAEKLGEAQDSWRPWLKEQAAKKLAENNSIVHPNVRAHWERLAR